jgi:hypothetical protein
LLIILKKTFASKKKNLESTQKIATNSVAFIFILAMQSLNIYIDEAGRGPLA